jgi:hypothetical protein
MQKRVGKSQNKRIRKLDKEAYERLKKRMTVVKITGNNRKRWEAVAKKSLKRLGQGVFPKDLMRQVAKLAGYDDIDI